MKLLEHILEDHLQNADSFIKSFLKLGAVNMDTITFESKLNTFSIPNGSPSGTA